VEPASKPLEPAPRSEFWTFFRQWLRRPLSTAAVSPSSRFLARRIVSALPPATRRVIELGAGTGTFTRALLASGIAAEDLLAIEFNPDLHRYLIERLPGVRILQADARELDHHPDVVAFAKAAPVQAIVSGLGLLAMPKSMQRAVLAGAFALMPDDGEFVQFTYGPVAPVAAEVLQEMQLQVRRRSFTLLNIPPASVFSFTRSRPQPIAPPRE
jgi:phosphatidylethanolamine/phosphatidyl-N-methylethanolamine N-methyltransferase